ncbi:MAG: enoyl-CoA hydratase/isomerase family protein [Chloroflexi bacterium]|nr:enoyl-CoA hydratase/isomerase family protein [Chloroflexota bacterium]
MPDLLYEKRQHYAIFTMNRPERLNALGGTMQQDLSAALEDFTTDNDMRVGIMTGTGERAFSAGADLKEMSARGQTAAPSARMVRIDNTFQLSRNPKPFIAAVNGFAIGGGMERAMDCDIRIAADHAQFGLMEIKRGILAGYGIHNLARLIPYGEAMYILLTGDLISAEEAQRVGFVHKVVARDKLMDEAARVAEMIAGNAPLSVRGTKAVAGYWRHFALDESYRWVPWVNEVVLGSEDAKEGPRAFAEKRQPVWQGR